MFIFRLILFIALPHHTTITLKPKTFWMSNTVTATYLLPLLFLIGMSITIYCAVDFSQAIADFTGQNTL